MTAIARALFRPLSTSTDLEILKAIAVFCGAGLFVSLLCAGYGLDLGFAFF
jgi:hypothetical protein